ncbi:MAG: hypothetical protein V4581_03450 [Bacteroidota bacterium]
MVITGCSTTKKKPEMLNVTVGNIDEYDMFFRFTGMADNDTLYIISWKEEAYGQFKDKAAIDVKDLDIVKDSTYIFKAQKSRFRISTMEQLGQYVVFDRDTLWSGSSTAKAPKYYIAQNSIGLKITQ